MYNRTTYIVLGLHIGSFFEQEVHHIVVTILSGYDERGQSKLSEINKAKSQKAIVIGDQQTQWTCMKFASPQKYEYNTI